MKIYYFIWIIFLGLAIGCKKDTENTADYSLTVDLTNYGANTTAIFNRYNNPIQYFAEHGLIALTNQYYILQAVGHNPKKAFQPMLDSFDVAQATQAKNMNQWNANFINKMNEKAAQPLIEQWLHAILFYARQLNQLLLTNPSDPNINILYSYLGDGVLRAIKPGYFELIRPPVFSPPSYSFTIYNEYCICQMLLPAVCLPITDSSDNTITSGKKPWWKVTEPYNTSCQGNCSALSTGLCLHKLGEIDSMVDGQTWYRISAEIKALEKGGAFNENISAYFDRLGYGVTKTNDVRDAYLALQRGCDAKIVYHDGSIIGGKQHIEYVTHINLPSAGSNQGVVHTISWGDSANVIVRDGNFSAKSDGDSYTGEPFLSKPGNAHFLIYCKK